MAPDGGAVRVFFPPARIFQGFHLLLGLPLWGLAVVLPLGEGWNVGQVESFLLGLSLLLGVSVTLYRVVESVPDGYRSFESKSAMVEFLRERRPSSSTVGRSSLRAGVGILILTGHFVAGPSTYRSIVGGFGFLVWIAAWMAVPSVAASAFSRGVADVGLSLWRRWISGRHLFDDRRSIADRWRAVGAVTFLAAAIYWILGVVWYANAYFSFFYGNLGLEPSPLLDPTLLLNGVVYLVFAAGTAGFALRGREPALVVTGLPTATGLCLMALPWFQQAGIVPWVIPGWIGLLPGDEPGPIAWAVLLAFVATTVGVAGLGLASFRERRVTVGGVVATAVPLLLYLPTVATFVFSWPLGDPAPGSVGRHLELLLYHANWWGHAVAWGTIGLSLWIVRPRDE